MQQEMVRGQESTFNSSQIFVKTGLLDRTITHVFRNLNVILVYRLYNKDAVIEFLLDKSADRPNSEVVSHLRGIKVWKLSVVSAEATHHLVIGEKIYTVTFWMILY
jgi:hypothetical protein